MLKALDAAFTAALAKRRREMGKVKCPYCGHVFPQDYYDNWHVPCPEPNGD